MFTNERICYFSATRKEGRGKQEMCGGVLGGELDVNVVA